MDQIHTIRLKDFMAKKVVFLNSRDTMVDAYEKMQLYGIRHLPVLNDQSEVVGIFTQTDLNRACPPRETESGWHYSKSELSGFILTHFVRNDPETLSTEDTLGKAAKVMARNKISCIPVVEPGTKKLAGVVTSVDVLAQIGRLLS